MGDAIMTTAGKKIEKKKPQIKLPTIDMNEEGACHITVGEGVLEQIFGGQTEDFGEAMLYHCINVSGRSKKLDQDKAYAVAIVNEIGPQNAIEGMLATQMAAIHIATMRHSRLMAGAESLQQLEVHERVLNKLARTYATQMEALRKHRNGGKQTVTVQHVNVEEGGQAIVGDVSHGGGEP